MSTKRSKIKAFDAFGKALQKLDTQDRELYSWPRNRLALCHALAMHLDALFQDQKNKISVDLCPVLNRSPKALNPDILVHNRTTKAQVLSVICRNDYLTEAEQEELIRFRRESKCDLVLALSFMVQKNYMLIYVANEDKIEYYHFERNSQTLEPVRSRNLSDQEEPAEQLTLDKILKRR